VPIDELANCIPAPALEETVEARELGLAINRFLGTISSDNRTLFLRRYWFGDSVQEISKDLGLRENAASVRLGRIRMQLREYLVKEGYVNE
jgi:RNA polymerase sigma-70 factor (ECF subfamily)